MRHLAAAVLLLAVTTTGCANRNKPLGYVASGALVVAGTLGVMAEPEPCNASDLGDNIGCGINQGVGEIMAYTALGLGVVGLAITALSTSESDNKAVR